MGSLTRATYHFYERVHQILIDEDRGVIFGERPKRLRADLGFEHGHGAMAETDAEVLERLFAYCEQQGQWLYENGEQLAVLIETAAGA